MNDEPSGGDDVTTDETDSIVVETLLDALNPAEELGDGGGGEGDDRRRQAEQLDGLVAERSPDEGQSHLVAVAYTAMVDAVEAGRFERLAVPIDRLATLVGRHPSSVHLRTLLARILTEATWDEGVAGRFDAQAAHLGRLESLAERVPDDEVTTALARARFFAAYHTGAAERFDELGTHIDRLDWLVEDTDDVGIRQEFAQALVNAMIDAGKAGRLDALDDRLNRLDLLVAEYPHSQLQVSLANALAIATFHSLETDRVDDCQTHLDRLDDLAAKYPNTDAIQGHCTSAHCHVVTSQGDQPACERSLDRLETLATDNPDTIPVQLRVSQAFLGAALTGRKLPDGFRPRLERLDVLLGADGNSDTDWQQRLAETIVSTGLGPADSARLDDSLEALLDSLDALVADHPDDDLLRLVFARTLQWTTAAKCEAGQFNATEASIDRLERLATETPDSDPVRHVFARTSVNAGIDAGEAGRLDILESHIHRLARLVTDHSDPHFRSALAKAHAVATVHQGRAARFDQVKAHLDSLEALAADARHEDEVLTHYANALANAAQYADDAGHSEGYWSRFDRFEALAADAPDSRVPFHLSDALFDTSRILLDPVFDEESDVQVDFGVIGACLDRLDRLTDDHPEDTEIQLQFARALANRVCAAPFADDGSHLGETSVRFHLDRLDALAARYPDATRIQSELASALYNAAVAAADGDHVADRRSAQARLDALAADYPDTDDVQRMLAKTLSLATFHDSEAGQFERVETHLDRLETLAFDHPAGDACQSELASALANVAPYQRRDGYVDDLAARFDRFETVSIAHSDVGIARSLAKGLVSTVRSLVVPVYMDGSDRRLEYDTIQRYLDRLEGLAGEYPTDEEIHRRLAEGLVTGVTAASHLAHDGRIEPDEHERYLDRLSELATEFPTDGGITAQLATAHRRVARDAGIVGAFETQQRHLDRLHELAYDHPHNDDVLFELAQALEDVAYVDGDPDAVVPVDCESYFDVVEAAALAYPADVNVLFQISRGLVTAAASEGNAGRCSELRACIDQLEEVVTDVPPPE
ncbi:hypothetical protein [Haloferax mediterranei]|uniref:hypothetical protein n=1 Tax=Haloferax mediterranei TaxID=2252 RepID=UPI000A7B04A6|nr:hypothetical protein [Haloferax mediterranei]